MGATKTFPKGKGGGKFSEKNRLEDLTFKSFKTVFIYLEQSSEYKKLKTLLFNTWHSSLLRTTFFFVFFKILDCEAIGTAATTGLLCQPRVIMKMIVEKQMECRLAGET
jgi:hypothetical protein